MATSDLPWLDLTCQSEKELTPSTYTFYDPNKVGLSTLENLVNTCFFNTVVQCLCHTQGMSKFILTGKYSRKNRLWKEFTDLVKTMWHDNYKISPKTMYTAFAFAFGKTNQNQEDFHEILVFILNHFHDALKYNVVYQDFNKGDLINKSIKSLNDTTQMSIVADLFQGQLHQRTQCTECKTVTDRFDSFFDIVLPLEKSTDYKNIYNLFHHFCGKETLQDSDAFHCDSCNKKVKAYKKTTFWRLPNYLIVVLNRFDWQQNKNEKKIDYPLTDLNLSSYVTYPNKPTYLYDLYAVACHTGSTRAGHYYTITTNNDRWVLINDDRFKNITDCDSVVCSDAYVLFYKRK